MTTDKNSIPAVSPDNSGKSAATRPGQADSNDPHNRKAPATISKDRKHRELTVRKDEAAVLKREHLAQVREEAAILREGTANVRENIADAREHAANVREDVTHSREDAAHIREENASSREQKIQVVETQQAASSDYFLMLRQANERLVITTIEAQVLAEKLLATQAQLESAKAIAEKANLAKSDFLSSMSHELRTPLNAILGFAQLLEAGSPLPTPSQAARLQQITKAGWYLLELINEILDLAVIESGRVTLLREPVSLSAVIRECQSIIDTQAQNHGIQIHYLPFNPCIVVNADHTRVKQILINLLSNAVKYNREHGTVEVECSVISPERIRISIRDSGAGLDAEKLAHLFQPFNRLGQEVGSEEGTGIGLVVSKRLVEMMGGSIGVKSTVGAGSMFWIELNGEVAPQIAECHRLPADSVAQTQETPPRFTLLYVEDNPANLLLVEQLIERHPHLRMLSARDGDEGVALARLHRPDVILMDINLPGISGVQVLNILHEEPATMYIPVIALSANAMPKDIESGLQAGFLRYLTKPVKIHEIMNALNDALIIPAAGMLAANIYEPTQTGKLP